jgi:Zn-dependent protease
LGRLRQKLFGLAWGDLLSGADEPMSWSFPIGSFKGTVVKVHLTLLIFLAWVGFNYYAFGGADAALSSIVFILLIFASVTAHEFGHVLVGRRFGVRTQDIILLPIGGASRMEEIPDDPKQEAMIGLAGPLVSLAIAGILILIMGRFPTFEDLAPERLAEQIVPIPQLALVNLLITAFNLLPAFPMDGGRILRAALSTRMGRLRATRTAARLGQAFAILFGLFGLLSGNIILMLIALFVYFAASAESGSVRMSEAARGLAAGDAMITSFESLPLHATVSDAADALLRTTQSEFPVTDSEGHFQGVLTRNKIIATLRDEGSGISVARAMDTDIPVVGRGSALGRLLPQLQTGATAAAVLDKAGHLLGYITLQNLVENMLIAEAPRQRSPKSGKARPAIRRN